MCGLCWTPLLSSVSSAPSSRVCLDGGGPVATLCGHVFHPGCLENRHHSGVTTHCPLCGQHLRQTGTINILHENVGQRMTWDNEGRRGSEETCCTTSSSITGGYQEQQQHRPASSRRSSGYDSPSLHPDKILQEKTSRGLFEEVKFFHADEHVESPKMARKRLNKVNNSPGGGDSSNRQSFSGIGIDDGTLSLDRRKLNKNNKTDAFQNLPNSKQSKLTFQQFPETHYGTSHSSLGFNNPVMGPRGYLPGQGNYIPGCCSCIPGTCRCIPQYSSGSNCIPYPVMEVIDVKQFPPDMNPVFCQKKSPSVKSRLSSARRTPSRQEHSGKVDIDNVIGSLDRLKINLEKVK